MSGQARRSKVLAAQRHRRQVERLISIAQPVDRFDDWAFGRHFDVHAARELGRRMVAMADEQRRYESARSEFCASLARGELPTIRGVFKPGAAMGRSIARQGQRLLDALASQPSECECIRVRRSVGAQGCDAGCNDCHGTGHNLRGVLPEAEVTANDIRKRQDAESHRTRRIGNDIHTYGWNDWVNDIHRDEGGPLWNGERMQMCYGRPDPLWTRVVPRGEHRESGDEGRRCLDWTPQPGENAGDRNTYAWRCAPRWRRGELRHNDHRMARRENPHSFTWAEIYGDEP